MTLRLVSISPQGGATAANGATGVTITYNEPLPANAAMPSLSPAVAGTWARQGKTVVFTPTSGYAPGTKVTVTADAGRQDGQHHDVDVTTGKYSTLRLQEILAQLGYLPLTWTPAAGATASGDRLPPQLAAAYDAAGRAPSAGSRGYPASAALVLVPRAASNTLETGARLPAFEADHGLDGQRAQISPAVWTDAAHRGRRQGPARTADGYSYAIASKHLPRSR